MTLQQDYERRCAEKSDINEHLPTFYALAREFQTTRVVEFGVRTGNSTAAWLAAGAYVDSYDINQPSYRPAQNVDGQWVFHLADTGADDLEISPCDILFIDTLHTGNHVRKELKHAHKCRKYIVLHDTILFGTHGELGQSGITGAIYDFLAENRDWRVKRHYENNCGLLILERV